MLIEGDLILADFRGSQHLAVYKGNYVFLAGAKGSETGHVVHWTVEARWNGQVRFITDEHRITTLQAVSVHHHVHAAIVRTIKALVMRHRGGSQGLRSPGR
jgi:hypothetical protein